MPVRSVPCAIVGLLVPDVSGEPFHHWQAAGQEWVSGACGGRRPCRRFTPSWGSCFRRDLLVLSPAEPKIAPVVGQREVPTHAVAGFPHRGQAVQVFHWRRTTRPCGLVSPWGP